MLAVGIVSVLGLIIGFKVNAFLAMVIAAVIVSLLVGGSPGARMEAVVSAFGTAAGGVGIVIAMAAIIGKCMLDSGAADRIVRTAVNITGERKASAGLMGSGFILGVPVFFDTVFYLLVPLARSLHLRTGRHYLRYLMAIATGGCITHTLVPPTPGPLLVSANLGVDVGMMMLVGCLVAIPSAIAGLAFSVFLDSVMPVPMRPLVAGENKHEPLPVERLPSLGVALLPVIIPVLLIGSGTLLTTLADREDRAQLTRDQIPDMTRFRDELRDAAAENPSGPAARFLQSASLTPAGRELMASEEPLDEAQQAVLVEAFNTVLLAQDLYDEQAFLGVPLSDTAQQLLASDPVRMKPVERRRMNRLLLEEAFPELVEPHQWDSSMRLWSQRLSLWSNPNFALLLAALVAIATLKWVRSLSLTETARDVEESLMSGGVIILITAAGGAFGTMLRDAGIGETIQTLFEDASAGGISLLLLAFGIASVLKIAQGSSTVAMIIASGMIGAIAAGVSYDYHPVYLGIAIGAGSLCGSWMNDSGFWVFAKMGGLTEGEALRSWTLLLLVLSVSGLLMTLLLSQLLPLV
nr:SLC13 family permease [Candidatus Laterigemmans baculatus]